SSRVVMPQILTRITPEELPNFGDDVAAGHQGLAHEDGVHAAVFQHADVVPGLNAALAHQDVPARHVFLQFQRVGDVHVERVEVTVVDSDDGGAGLEGPLDLGGGV